MHDLNGFCTYALQRAAPPCVNCGYSPMYRIIKQYGNTICRPYGDGNPHYIGDKGIDSLQLLPRNKRIGNLANLTAMNLIGLNCVIGQFGIPLGAECLHMRSNVISQITVVQETLKMYLVSNFVGPDRMVQIQTASYPYFNKQIPACT